MPFYAIRHTRIFAFAVCLLSAAASSAQGVQTPFAKLEALQVSPESAGLWYTVGTHLPSAHLPVNRSTGTSGVC
jgi:hypothetical protein